MRTAVLAGVLAVVAMALTYVWLDRDGGGDGPVTASSPERVANDPDVVADFLDAWDRFRSATFVAEWTVTRTFDDGRALTRARRLAQDPPRRLASEDGSVAAGAGTLDFTCTVNAGDVFVCGGDDDVADPDAAYAAAVSEARSTLEGYVSGLSPAYLLAVDSAGCFSLEPTRVEPLAEFGIGATVCFDDDTGVLRYQEVRRDGATDVTTLADARTDVEASDFAVTVPPGR